MTFSVDAVVIGAGVVGLACARRLAKAGLETVVLEKERGIGQGISSRNSEVIHAGLYYSPGSMKARLCRSGADRLYRYCEERGVGHRRVGKLVVATEPGQIGALEKIALRAQENGCVVSLMSAAEALHLEPALRCTAALHSPGTGIIDSHGLMTSLLADFEHSGGTLVLRSPVLQGRQEGNGIGLELADAENTQLLARYVVNAAGLDAPLVAASIDGVPKRNIPKRCFAKGSYFTLTGRNPFGRLIYPVPEAGGLGVHLTLDLQGQACFGPDVEWVEDPDYKVDEAKREPFVEAIQRYWPGCERHRLTAGYAGIRPKLGTLTAFAEDFVLQSPDIHGVPGLINLMGIESPGLTSCLAIADEVMARLGLDGLDEET